MQELKPLKKVTIKVKELSLIVHCLEIYADKRAINAITFIKKILDVFRGGKRPTAYDSLLLMDVIEEYAGMLPKDCKKLCNKIRLVYNKLPFEVV